MNEDRILELFSGKLVDTWYDNGDLIVQVTGIVRIRLDKEMAQELYLAMEKSNSILNKNKLELETWNATS